MHVTIAMLHTRHSSAGIFVCKGHACWLPVKLLLLFGALLALLQLLFDFGAAYSIFISSTFFALGPPFWGRVVLVYLLDFLAIYFAIGIFFDVVTLTSILFTTFKLGTAPMAFYDGKHIIEHLYYEEQHMSCACRECSRKQMLKGLYTAQRAEHGR
jgi:hypothetical protein